MYSISDYIRLFSNKIADSAMIIFLGTGPTDPIKKSGKSGRDNTSTLIKYKDKSYLIDIGKTFDKKVKFDYLIVTHLHSDAFDGIKYVKDRDFIFALPKELSESEHIEREKFWDEQILKVNKKNKIGDLTTIPFPVKHDVAYGYKTFGYQFIINNKKITYASDMVGIPEKSEKYFDNIDILIADGAGWKSNLSTHFGIWPFMELVEKKDWNIGKIYFVQIGRPVPDHEKAQKELSEKYDNVFLTYDGMKLDL